MNNLTAKRVIKRQYNTIVDEEAKIRRVLAMETDDSLPSQLSVGLLVRICLLYTSPSPRDGLLSRMPSSA